MLFYLNNIDTNVKVKASIIKISIFFDTIFILHYIYITFTYSHLADAFIQSDLQMEVNRSNQNQQKSNNMQVL